MIRALALIIALALAPAAQAKTVLYDPGGLVVPRFVKFLKLKDSGEEVRILGLCASACTFYISMSRKQVCIGKHAVLGFHAAWLRPWPFYKEAPAGTLLMWNQYPHWARKWITERGGLKRKMLFMPASYARQYMRAC